MHAEPSPTSAAELLVTPEPGGAPPPPGRRRNGRLMCWALLGLLLIGSGWATWANFNLMQQRRAYAFAAQTELLKLRLEDRLELYRNLSRTLLGYFQASPSIEHPGWRSYVLALQLDRHYPFLDRVWFAFDLSNEAAGAYLQQRADPAEPASFWSWEQHGAERRPASRRDRQLPLLYVYPADTGLPGLDTYGTAAEAIERAYGKRETVLAADFVLLRDEAPRLAFITPLFRQRELAASTTPALEGIIGVSFSDEQLFTRLLDEAPAALSVEVYRGHGSAPQSLLFDDDNTPLQAYPDPPAHLRTIPVEYDGQPLTLVFHAPRFWRVTGIDDRAPLFVGAAGLLVSLLGFAIAWSLESTRERATAIAERMTRRLRDANAMLSRLATTDSLTGLLNRRAFVERLEHELERARRHDEPCSLLMMDIDHFKQINDTYGHPAGDSVLRDVGSLLLTELREGDVAARMGGEEFALLLPRTGLEQARTVAEQLRRIVSGLDHRCGGQQFGCSASFGVASTSTSPDATAETLLSAADRALYRAKNAGRDRVMASSDGEFEAVS